MTTSSSSNDAAARSADVAGSLALRAGARIGVAESLTGGQLASRLAAGADAADWFRGGVVAYAPEVKFAVLGVEPGPVNTASCAAQMALGAVRLLDAEIAVAATGVGGPGPDEHVPAGTVFVACADWTGEVVSREHHFSGAPSEVVESAVDACLEFLVGSLDPVSSGLAPWRDCHHEFEEHNGSGATRRRTAT
jgi:nicotinamide-nucleotide amidase